tara:strand:+ start:626 stop:1387 length:762 start_codon:yes stop_codon:yes gene_type:complete
MSLLSWTTDGSNRYARMMVRFHELLNAGADLEVPLHYLLQNIGAGGVSGWQDPRKWQAKRLWAFKAPQFARGISDFKEYLALVPSVPKFRSQDCPPQFPVLVDPAIDAHGLRAALDVAVDSNLVDGSALSFTRTPEAPLTNKHGPPYWLVCQTSHQVSKDGGSDHQPADWTLAYYAFEGKFMRRGLSFQEMMCALLQGHIMTDRPTTCVGSAMVWGEAHWFPCLTHRKPDFWTLDLVPDSVTLNHVDVITTIR